MTDPSAPPLPPPPPPSGLTSNVQFPSHLPPNMHQSPVSNHSSPPASLQGTPHTSGNLYPHPAQPNIHQPMPPNVSSSSISSGSFYTPNTQHSHPPFDKINKDPTPPPQPLAPIHVPGQGTMYPAVGPNGQITYSFQPQPPHQSPQHSVQQPDMQSPHQSLQQPNIQSPHQTIQQPNMPSPHQSVQQPNMHSPHQAAQQPNMQAGMQAMPGMQSGMQGGIQGMGMQQQPMNGMGMQPPLNPSGMQGTMNGSSMQGGMNGMPMQGGMNGMPMQGGMNSMPMQGGMNGMGVQPGMNGIGMQPGMNGMGTQGRVNGMGMQGGVNGMGMQAGMNGMGMAQQPPMGGHAGNVLPGGGLQLKPVGGFKDMNSQIHDLPEVTITNVDDAGNRLFALKSKVNELQAKHDSYKTRQIANGGVAAASALFTFGASLLVQGPAAVHQHNRMQTIKRAMGPCLEQINILRDAYGQHPSWQQREASVTITEKVFASGVSRNQLQGSL